MGHVAFFGFISELKEPRDYDKALYLLQGTNTSLYVIAAVVIYRYGGSNVASPALGSTGPVLRKVAYGVAIPTVSFSEGFSLSLIFFFCFFISTFSNLILELQIVIAGVVNGHVAVKYIYVRIFRGTDHMHKRSMLSVSTWIGLALALWVIGWIIAEAIPVFDNLLSLIVSFCHSLHPETPMRSPQRLTVCFFFFSSHFRHHSSVVGLLVSYNIYLLLLV